MKLLAAWRRLALVFALAAQGALAEPAQPPQQQPAQTPPRQILVMLHLPPAHYRPGADYTAGYQQAPGNAARRALAQTLAREYGLTLLEDWAMPVIGVDCYRMQEPQGALEDAILAALARDRRVEWAQPINEFAAQGEGRAQTPDDPLFPVQPAARDWQLAALHPLATGRKVRVAVIDSGVEADHPDLAGQVVAQENFVDGQRYVAEDHGTAVAGIIAARAGNHVGIVGVAPQARLMALRACWQSAQGTRCNSFTLGKALNYALLHDARVVNLSLSGPGDRLLGALLDAAQARGVLVVGAVDPARADGGFPATHPAVFAVSNAAAPGLAAQALPAPGQDIPTAAPGARWQIVSGSSYAAAHVSGLLAVLTELAPGQSARQLRANLVVDAAGGAEGAARHIDVCATLARMGQRCGCADCGALAAARPVAR